MSVVEIESKTALNKLHSKFLPYSWDLNVYRGCSHHCQYCYALYSHKYLTDKNFFGDIFVKKNIIEILDKELSSKRWKKEVINLGGVTDNYQPLEQKYGLMREVLKLMIKYQNPITISTKSDLILRDKDLLIELAKKTMVNVAVTVITMDEDIRKKIEPGAKPSIERFKALSELKGNNIGLGLHFMPIIPKITDSRENIETVFIEASKISVDYMICGMLNLRSTTKINFLDFVKKEMPAVFDEYAKIYDGAFIKKDYGKNIYKIIHELKNKYKINSNFMKYIPKKSEPSQMKLW